MSSPSIPSHWRLQKSKYTLTGTRCKTCQEYFYPPRYFCKNCRRKGNIEEFQFQGIGEIISHTVIRTAPEGFEINAPYTIAMIKLEEGPTITGQVIGNIKEVEAGKKVKVVFRKMYEDGPDGQIFYGLKWEITS